MPASQPGMIPCPSCSRPLALPIESVLAGQAIICGGCGLELTAQRETSQRALDALGSWYQETAAARSAAARNAAAPSAAAPEPAAAKGPKLPELRRRAARPRR